MNTWKASDSEFGHDSANSIQILIILCLNHKLFLGWKYWLPSKLSSYPGYLIFFTSSNKCSAPAQIILTDAYSDDAVSKWRVLNGFIPSTKDFQNLKTGIGYGERKLSKITNFRHNYLRRYQRHEHSAGSLEVVAQAFSKRIKVMESKQKQGNLFLLVVHDFDGTRHLFGCEQLLQEKEWNIILHLIGKRNLIGSLTIPARSGIIETPRTCLHVDGLTDYSCVQDLALHLVLPAWRSVLWHVEPIQKITWNLYRTKIWSLLQALKDKPLPHNEKNNDLIL